MRRTAIHIAILCFCVVTLAQIASAQKYANVAGKWDVTIKMPDKNITEQWIIQQDKAGNVTATVKTGADQLNVKGEVNNALLRFDYKVGELEHKIRATVDGNEMDGSVTMGKKEYVWSAKRAK
jgi:hypothetical protein